MANTIFLIRIINPFYYQKESINNRTQSASGKNLNSLKKKKEKINNIFTTATQGFNACQYS